MRTILPLLCRDGDERAVAETELLEPVAGHAKQRHELAILLRPATLDIAARDGERAHAGAARAAGLLATPGRLLMKSASHRYLLVLASLDGGCSS